MVVYSTASHAAAFCYDAATPHTLRCFMMLYVYASAMFACRLFAMMPSQQDFAKSCRQLSFAAYATRRSRADDIFT